MFSRKNGVKTQVVSTDALGLHANLCVQVHADTYQKRRTITDFNDARDDGMAVAPAGPRASHLHLAPDR